ncbi:MAG: helix-turn-helix domain-containing protein [Vicinamibacterales bacterium]
MPEIERNEPEKLLDVNEVASILGVHAQTVYAMARSGEMKSIRTGRIWKFRPSDVKAWQDSKVTAA